MDGVLVEEERDERMETYEVRCEKRVIIKGRNEMEEERFKIRKTKEKKGWA
jgi:hypothetical protein